MRKGKESSWRTRTELEIPVGDPGSADIDTPADLAPPSVV
jgi:hypothetical protein